MAAGGASSLHQSFAPSSAPTRLTSVPSGTVSSSAAATRNIRADLQKFIGNSLQAADGRCHPATPHLAEALCIVLTSRKEEDALTSEVRDLRRSNEDLLKENSGLREEIDGKNHDLELQQTQFKSLEEKNLKVEDENRLLRAQMQEQAAKYQADREKLVEENRAARAEMEINHMRALEEMEQKAKVKSRLQAKIHRTGRTLELLARGLQGTRRQRTLTNRSRPREARFHGRR